MEFLQNNRWFPFVFIGVCIAFIAVLYFAVKSASSHNRTFKAHMAEMEELTRLKNKYKNITPEELACAPDEEVLAGVNAVIQSRFSAADTDAGAMALFQELSEEDKLLYTLQIFVEDGSVGSFFFKNDAILLSRIVPALEMIGMTDFAQRLSYIVKMHDKDDETISYEKEKIVKLDEYVEECEILTEIKLNASKFIKDNRKINC